MNNAPLKRFLVEDLGIENDFCVITGGEARHMSRVLRMGTGDALILLDGKGGRFLGEVESISHDAVTVKIKENMGPARAPTLEINLCHAVIKSGPMDYLIQKTSELGVTRLFPFFSAHSVVRLKGERREKKHHRWKEIARNAAKQCRRDVPAEIKRPTSFDELLLSLGDPGPKVILWEKESARDLKTLLKKQDPPRSFTGIIGPEGGFTSEEIDSARRAGVIPVSMGSRILRAETAALALVTIVQYEWGDLCLSFEEKFTA